MTIDEYILSHSDEEGALLSALNRDANVNLLRPRMLSGHLQGRILKMFCRMLRPRRVLEIGTYTGYATLCMAEGISLTSPSGRSAKQRASTALPFTCTTKTPAICWRKRCDTRRSGFSVAFRQSSNPSGKSCTPARRNS